MKEFICPFDKNHQYTTQPQLKTHIQKCKSPNRSNFERCRHNEDHWVNFNKIKQHEQQCTQQISSSSIELEGEGDSTIEYLMKAMEEKETSHHHSNIEEEIEKMKEEESRELMKKKKNKNKKQEQPEEKEKFWVEPSFKKWLTENPKAIAILQYDQQSD